MSIRPHSVNLLTAQPADTTNMIAATVTRNVFLGSVRDYVALLADGTELRVTAPPSHNIAPGTAVLAHLPQPQCLALVS